MTPYQINTTHRAEKLTHYNHKFQEQLFKINKIMDLKHYLKETGAHNDLCHIS